jgi:hypothetical protein
MRILLLQASAKLQSTQRAHSFQMSHPVIQSSYCLIPLIPVKCTVAQTNFHDGQTENKLPNPSGSTRPWGSLSLYQKQKHNISGE